MHVSSDQLRAARALLRLEQADLATRAHVSAITIRRLEGAKNHDQVSEAARAEVRQALEQAGAEFIPGGVRRRAGAGGDLFEKLRIISLRSAEQLQSHDTLTDDDLYDEGGLPA